jgi:hypothetical protein
MKSEDDIFKWNQSIEFCFRYPPLVNLVKFELCKETAVLATEYSTVLATEYFSLNDIFNSENNDEPYSFGPSYIELYSRPNNCRIKKTNGKNSFNWSYDSLNADGSYYIGRLLLKISSSLDIGNRSLSEIDYLTVKDRVKKEKFILLCIISDANMIDSRYRDGEIKFKLTFGKSV